VKLIWFLVLVYPIADLRATLAPYLSSISPGGLEKMGLLSIKSEFFDEICPLMKYFKKITFICQKN
jgi:hypothetical protein